MADYSVCESLLSQQCVAYEDGAVAELCALIRRLGGDETTASDIVARIDPDAGIVSAEDVRRVGLQGLGRKVEDSPIEIIDAYNVPKLVFERSTKKIHVETENSGTIMDSKSLVDVHLKRLNLIIHRVERHRMFMPDRIGSRSNTIKIIDIKSLRGMVGTKCFLLGVLFQRQERTVALEDTSGCVDLDLTATQSTEGLFTESSVVLVEGEMRIDGVFDAKAMGFPPLEPKEDVLKVMKGVNYFGGQAISEEIFPALQAREIENVDERIFVFSDVWLDKQTVRDDLSRVFQVFNDMGEDCPELFVLMGNFHSETDVDIRGSKMNFKKLANIFNRFENLKENAHFVFVPGPNEFGDLAVLPKFPLMDEIVAPVKRVLKKVTFTTNPCRVRLFTQEIVILREELLNKMLRSLVKAPKLDSSSQDSLFKACCSTLIHQSHLCPVPSNSSPIYSQLDHALQIYPQPDLFILADGAQMQASVDVKGVACLSPGRFCDKLFAAYLPASRTIELSAVPTDE
ncbi:hypothetical protein BSKO_11832 [Bryopsis sp. KO-2023]|nr:hypothetical protein BSKO_11832 [Bryopsis sp. KO-2023]